MTSECCDTCSVKIFGEQHCVCFDEVELLNTVHHVYTEDAFRERNIIIRERNIIIRVEASGPKSIITRCKTMGFYEQNVIVAVGVIERAWHTRQATHGAMAYRFKCIATARIIQTSLRNAMVRRVLPTVPDLNKQMMTMTYRGPNPLYQTAVNARLAELIKLGPSTERRLALLAEQCRQRIEAIMINEACIADGPGPIEMCGKDMVEHERTLTNSELKNKLLEKLRRIEDAHMIGCDLCRLRTSWPPHEFIEQSQYDIRHSDFLHRPNFSYLKEWPP